MNTKVERVFYHFNEINKVPRMSGNEKGISDKIKSWSQAQGLKVIQDEFNNLIITKPASSGYESAAPVILQAHMDMVCEKTSESTHDFAKDPIISKISGDWMMSACGTTLGADDGIGVACAMAVLEDKTLKHPEIEVILTVEEETSFSGAENISADNFSGRRMINLDHAADNEVLAGSCGGSGIQFKMALKEIKDDFTGAQVYTLKISGMRGGHSGEDIHRGRGNAITLLTQIIDNCNLQLISLKGGTNRLAIPRDARAEILTADAAALAEKLKEMEASLKKEYAEAAPDITVSLEKSAAAKPERLYDCRKALKVISLFPNGIMSMNGKFQGIVESSINLGIISLEGDTLEINAEARGGYVSSIERIKEKVMNLADLSGGTVGFYVPYTPWEYSPDSPLRKTAVETYRQLFGEEMQELIVHAGLECGNFIEKAENFDAVSIGPNCQFFHSPDERISISSTEKFCKFLFALLENLN